MPTKFGRMIRGKLFSKVFLLAYVLFMGYAAYTTDKAICLLSGRTHIFGAVYILYALLGILVIAKKSIASKLKGRFFKKAMSFLSCFLIYYFGTFLLWKAVCLFAPIPDNTNAIGTLCSILVGMVIVVAGYLNTKRITVKKYSISLDKCRSDYRIALISDIHLGFFVGEKHIRRVVQKINTLKPDAVIIAGDIFDTDNALLDYRDELKAISKCFRKIKSKDGVYAVIGNHDPELENKEFRHFIKSSGIKLLNNEVRVLDAVNLVGRTDDAKNNREALDTILPFADTDKPVIVIDHKPENIDEAVNAQADLVLCGHTHRGQMFPVTIFTKWANGKKRFYGHGITSNTHTVITSGVGFFELPMRLGTDNEIVEIKING